MPLSDSFWNLTYNTFGIDPLSSDRESRLSALTPRLQANQGLWAGDMEPYQEFSLGGLLGGSVVGAIGGIAQLGGDIFDSVSDQIDKGNAWMLDLAGREDLGSMLRDRTGIDTPNVVQEWGADVKDSSALLREQSLSPMESGGGIWEELKAGGLDLGEEGPGLSPGEAASRLAGFGVDMGVAAAEGYLLGPAKAATTAKALFNAVGAGFAAQSLTDTTVNRRAKGDGWMASLALGSADAATTYYLERAGLESMFGNGVAKAINATGLSKSRAVNGALQGLVGLLGEGSTEAAQTFTNVLINELPDAQSEDWDKVSKRIQLRLSKEMPEAFAGGALFGGALGVPSGAMSRPFYTPEAKLGASSADALGSTTPISDRVNEVLTDVVSDLRKVDDDGRLDPVVNEALQDIAESALSDAEARSEAIEEQIKEQEAITASLQDALTPEVVDQVGAVLESGIQEAVMTRMSKVEQLQLMWQQLTTPMEIPGEDGVLVQTPIAEPGEIVAAMRERAQAEGIEIPEEQLVSGNIDWNGVMAQEAEKAESAVTSKLSSVAGAISKIVEVDPESAVGRLASQDAKAMPVVESPASPVLATQRVRNLIYSPDLSQLAMRSGAYELGGLSALREVSRIREQGITGAMARKMAESGIGERVLSRIPEAAQLLDSIERSVDGIRSFYTSGEKTTRKSLSDWEAAANELGSSIDKLQQLAVVAQAPRLSPEGMDIESINQVSRLVSPPAGTRAPDIEAAVRDTGVIDPDAIDTLAMQREAGERAAPWIKWLTHSVWQLGTPEARAMVETATLSPDAITNTELGTVLKNHLVSVGQGEIAAELDTATLGQAMKEVGKNITTPWAIERVMRLGGASPLEIKATIAIIDRMAARWTKKNGTTVYEFYDRLGDYTKLVDVLSHNVLAEAVAASPEQSKMQAWLGSAQKYARGMLAVFTSERIDIGTISHEMMHLLETSGLLIEMLEPAEIAKFEQWLGAKLVDENGKQVRVDRVPQEKMAMAFERFLVENKAPKGIRHLFERIKYWMANIVDSLRSPEGVAYNSGEGFVVKWNEIELNQGAIDSFHMLLNAKPDGSDIEYVSSAGAPGVARALELQVSRATGLPADGFLTALAPVPQRAYQHDSTEEFFDRFGRIWWHGGSIEGGLDAIHSDPSGLVGPGVYLTIDKNVAGSYAGGNGLVYSVSVGDVGKIIDADEKIPKDLIDNIDRNWMSLWIHKFNLEDSEIYDMTLMEIFDALGGDGRRALHNVLRDLGYGAITHVGGLRAGRGKRLHQVLVLIDPAGSITQGAPIETSVTPTVTSPGKIKHKITTELNIPVMSMLGNSVYLVKGQVGDSIISVDNAKRRTSKEGKLLRDAAKAAAKKALRYRHLAEEFSGNVGKGVAFSIPDAIFFLGKADRSYPGLGSEKAFGEELIKELVSAGVKGISVPIGNDTSAVLDLTGMVPFDAPKYVPIATQNWLNEQWKAHLGLVNGDAAGVVWHTALEEMEEERRRRAEWDGVQPPLSAIPPDKEANKAIQNAMALEAPLATESSNYDELMGTFEKLLINSSKDIFNHGKPTHGIPDRVINSLKNFVAGMQKANDIRRQAGMQAAVRKVGEKIRKDSYLLAESGWKAFERALGNYGASYEGVFKELGMPEISEYINNLHSIGKMATNVLYKLPMVMDPESMSWREIPGGERWIDIEIDFAHAVEALWKSRWEASGQKTYKQFFQEMRRDLAVFMVAKRQIELSERIERELAKWEGDVEAWEKGKAALGDGVPYVPKPKKPTLPYVNPKTTAVSKNALALLTARYGKDLSILDKDSLRRVKWVNNMVLDKLLFYKMITKKAYDDMKAAGARYIPLYKVKDVLDSAGITDQMMDSSMYDVLKYLKTDATKGVENPLEALTRKAMAAEVLTHRQLGKNALGSAINRNMNFYNTEGKHGVEVLSKVKNVTEEEWLATPEGRRLAQTIKVKKDRHGNPLIDSDGKRIEERSYPIRVNVTAEDLDHVLNALAAHRKENVSHEAARQEVMRRIFTFYEEPGVPTYLLFTDPQLAESAFHLNNPQAVMAASVIEGLLSKTAGVLGKVAKLAFGWNSIIKNFFVTNPQFQYNAVARDALFAPTRSRHGLNPLDYPRGAKEALYANLSSLREVDPEKHWLAHDASLGTGMFSGLVSGGGRSLADLDMLAYLQTGKKALIDDAKGGDAGSAKKLMLKDLRTFAAREGLASTPTEIIREIRSGDRNLSSLLLVPWSALQSVFVSLRMLGNVQENAYRMSERELAAHEEITDPRLLNTGIYKTSPEHLVGGKVRAGFTGNRHRFLWWMEKKRMAADPDYVPPVSSMPVQFSAASRDYSANHVTLHFPQKGTRTHDIETVSVFFNPNVQDTYTSLRKIAQHSLVQKALAAWGGRKWEAAANQQRLDAETSRWLLLNTLYLSLPMLTSLAYYSGDDDESRKWQSRTFMEKLSYWHIPFPGLDEPLRIASGIGLASLLFKDLPAAAWMQMSEQDPGAMKKWGKRFLEGTPLGQFIGPVVDYAERGVKGAISGVMSRWSNELVNPAAQMAMNWDTYREREIQWRTNIDPTETGRHAYGALAAKVAKVFGPDLQPAEAAFLIKSYTPGVLSVFPATIDWMASESGMAPEDVLASNSPVKSQGAQLMPKFTSPTPWGMSNESVQWVMRAASKSDQQLGAWKKMPEGRQPAYLAENPLADIELNSMLNSVRKSVHYGEDQAKSALLGEDKWKNSTIEEREKAAMDIRRLYSMEALEAMREVMGSI